MKRLVGMLVALSMVLMLGSPVVAEDAQEEAKQVQPQKPAPNNQRNRQRQQGSLAQSKLKELAEVGLTEEQTAKIKALAAEFQPKLREARQKVNAVTPADQRKARQELLAKARAEGKDLAEVRSTFKPTEEQQAAQKAVREVNTAFNQKVNEVLTQQQRQTLRKNRRNAAQNPPAAEQKPAPKKAEPKPE